MTSDCNEAFQNADYLLLMADSKYVEQCEFDDNLKNLEFVFKKVKINNVLD